MAIQIATVVSIDQTYLALKLVPFGVQYYSDPWSPHFPRLYQKSRSIHHGYKNSKLLKLVARGAISTRIPDCSQ